MGPRRVGKTVMIHHAIAKLINEGVDPRKICYVSIDHPIYNGLGLDDLLDTFMENTEVNYSKEECYLWCNAGATAAPCSKCNVYRRL